MCQAQAQAEVGVEVEVEVGVVRVGMQIFSIMEMLCRFDLDVVLSSFTTYMGWWLDGWEIGQ